MWPRVRSPWRPCLGWIRCLCRGDELHTEGGVPWALGRCSLRSADGLVIIISTPLSYLTTSPCASWTAGSLASLQCAIFLLVLYFAHNINLYRDPAPGFIHLCLTSGDISHWGFCFFSSSSSSSAESKLLIFFFVTLSIVPILSKRQRHHLCNPVQKSASASRILVKELKGGTFEKSRPFKSRSDVCCHCCIVVVNI